MANIRPIWRIMTGICVERWPLISPPMTNLEIRYSKYLQQKELEKSLLSSHERRIEDDRKRVAAKKALATAPVITALGSEETLKTRVLAIDDEHKWSEQAKAFRTANRLTQADEQNDQRALNRSLDRKLLLLVRQRLNAFGEATGEQKWSWTPPLVVWRPDETMRSAANRALNEFANRYSRNAGEALSHSFRLMGNAPAAVYERRFLTPDPLDGAIGAKVFFYKAQLIGPLQLDVGLSKQSATQSPHQSMTSAEEKARADALGVSAAGARFEMQLDDWRWLRRDEIVAQLGPPSRSYSHLLRRLMIDI